MKTSGWSLICWTQKEGGQAGYCAVAWMYSHWSRKIKYCFKTQANGPFYIYLEVNQGRFPVIRSYKDTEASGAAGPRRGYGAWTS